MTGGGGVEAARSCRTLVGGEKLWTTSFLVLQKVVKTD